MSHSKPRNARSASSFGTATLPRDFAHRNPDLMQRLLDSSSNSDLPAGARTPSPSPSPSASPRGSISGKEPLKRQSSMSGRESIQVLVRCRPLLPHEQANKKELPITLDKRSAAVSHVAMNKTYSFTYDEVFNADSAQAELWDVAKPIVNMACDGLNGTIFAYGQTSSGKTHTMMGNAEEVLQQGIIPRAVEHLFQHVRENSSGAAVKYLIMVSFLEIYNENVRDLLASGPLGVPLDVRQTPDLSFVVPDLSRHLVATKEDLMGLIAKGNKNRIVASTAFNAESSRSHSMLTIYIEKSETVAGHDKIVAAKLNLVDLAGSERLQDSTATMSKESVSINQSLTCLAKVISALTSDKPNTFVPYRDSKLTRLLKDSLGGNSKTLMIACVNPNPSNAGETLSTLRYASRAKQIKNKPVVNEDPKDALLHNLMEEIERLKDSLQQRRETQQKMVELVKGMLPEEEDSKQSVFQLGGAHVVLNGNHMSGQNQVDYLTSFIQLPPAAHKAAAKWATKTFGSSRSRLQVSVGGEEKESKHSRDKSNTLRLPTRSSRARASLTGGVFDEPKSAGLEPSSPEDLSTSPTQARLLSRARSANGFALTDDDAPRQEPVDRDLEGAKQLLMQFQQDLSRLKQSKRHSLSLKESEALNARYKKENEALRSQLEMQEARINELQGQLSAVAYAAAMGPVDDVKGVLTQKQLHAILDCLETKKTNISNLERELAESVQAKEEVCAYLESARSESRLQKQQIADLHADVERLKASLDAAQRQETSALERTKSAESELNEARQQGEKEKVHQSPSNLTEAEVSLLQLTVTDYRKKETEWLEEKARYDEELERLMRVRSQVKEDSSSVDLMKSAKKKTMCCIV